MRGGDKLLEPVEGRALLSLQASRALSCGAKVVVTLPVSPHSRHAALADLTLARVEVPDAAEGMAASIRAGIAAMPAGTDAAMVLPADMPEIDAADMAAMIAAWEPGEILRGAAADGTPGHPVIFPADLFEELATLSGDTGAREVLVRHRQRIRLLPLPDRHALTDLDTPEAWADWRARHGG